MSESVGSFIELAESMDWRDITAHVGRLEGTVRYYFLQDRRRPGSVITIAGPRDREIFSPESNNLIRRIHREYNHR